MIKILNKKISTFWGAAFIVLVAAITGAITIWRSQDIFQETPPLILPQKEKQKIELTENIANKIVDNIVPQTYDRESAEFLIEDFNADGTKEVIISSAPQAEPTKEAYLVLAQATDEAGNYKILADFSFTEEDDIWFRGVPKIESSDHILDIDKDGKKEMVLDLRTGGASNEAYGIFKIDWDTNKIEWLKIQKEDQIIENTYFLQGGSVMHQESFKLEDLDGDEILEIIEKLGQYIGDSGEQKDWTKEENWEWQTWVYGWNGSIFVFNQELSDLLSGGFCGWSTLDQCFSDSDCVTGGCSSQVCQSKGEEPVVTTCEWQDCYRDEIYDLSCKCLDNKCQWTK
jgi:eight-cysteine-cluster-containing protein